MKYLITESQIDKVIFKYLDNQDFVIIKRKKQIYFANSDNDKFSQIRYDKKDGWCFISYKLIEEISRFFSLHTADSEEIIGRWVGNTLKLRITSTDNYPGDEMPVMVIPPK
jgi:hypothetical protein